MGEVGVLRRIGCPSRAIKFCQASLRPYPEDALRIESQGLDMVMRQSGVLGGIHGPRRAIEPGYATTISRPHPGMSLGITG
jgi:hypothetical protein